MKKRGLNMVKDDPLLRELLRSRDIACPDCGYNLRDNQSSVCPECGVNITIERLVHPRLRVDLSWALAFVGVAGGLPDSIRMWHRLVAWHVIDYGYVEMPAWKAMAGWLSAAYWLSLAPLVVLALCVPRRFVRLGPAVRWCVAIGAVLLWLLGHRRCLLWYW
jgi:hypothetical protein